MKFPKTLDTTKPVRDYLHAIEQKVLVADIKWDRPLTPLGPLNTMSGHLEGYEQFPFVISVIIGTEGCGDYSVCVSTDAGMINTKHDAPTGLQPCQDTVAEAIDRALQFARGVVVARTQEAATAVFQEVA